MIINVLCYYEVCIMRLWFCGPPAGPWFMPSASGVIIATCASRLSPATVDLGTAVLCQSTGAFSLKP